MQKQFFHPGGLAITEIGAQKATISAEDHVLDIGCGTGASLEFLHHTYGCAVSGIDLSSDAVTLTKNKLPDSQVLVCDACELPFQENTFHAAFMECTLTLFHDPIAALAEAHRVLTLDGTLVISCLTRPTEASLVSDGAVSLSLLKEQLTQLGFSHIEILDFSQELIQFVVDIIFNYGSIQEYLIQANDTLNGAIFSCDVSPKDLHYHMIIAKK